MEQLTFITTSLPSDISELNDALNDMILKISSEQGVETKFLTIEERKQKDEIIGYSVWILEPMDLNKSDRVFAITPKDTSKTKRFEIELRYDRRDWLTIPDTFTPKISEVKNTDKETGEVFTTKKYSLYAPLDSSEIYQFLYDILFKAVKEFKPSERFGCCEKYVACSDAKKCLHSNNFYARCCWYRQNLEAEHIFYGKNKTIAD